MDRAVPGKGKPSGPSGGAKTVRKGGDVEQILFLIGPMKTARYESTVGAIT